MLKLQIEKVFGISELRQKEIVEMLQLPLNEFLNIGLTDEGQLLLHISSTCRTFSTAETTFAAYYCGRIVQNAKNDSQIYDGSITIKSPHI